MAYVVVRKEPASKRLVVAYEDDAASGLFSSEAIVGSLSWLHGPREGALLAQPRYRAKAERVQVEPVEGEDSLRVNFERPQRALTPGQVCAFYDGGQLLGAGVFESGE
jgi:tRNA-specific 2-thiouridylase